MDGKEDQQAGVGLRRQPSSQRIVVDIDAAAGNHQRNHRSLLSYYATV